MTFFNTIKRALGLSSDADDEIEGIDATVHPMSTYRSNDSYRADLTEKANQTDSPAKTDSPAQPLAAEDHERSRLAIFDTVVEIFDKALPEFISESVDPEAQKRYIYNALDDSLKAYIERLGVEVRQNAKASWNRDRQRLETETRDLRDRIASLQEREQSARQQQLSADRQLRTLKERAHDLEAQIASLEAEKEQYDLENKSLLNKLRLAEVNGADPNAEPVYSPESEKIIEELTTKLQIAQTMADDLRVEASTAKDTSTKAQAEIDELKASVETLKADNAKLADDLKSANEELAAASEIAEMVSQFEKVAADKDKRIRDLKAEIDALNAQIEEKKTSSAQEDLFPPLQDIKKETESKPRRARKPRITAIDESIDDTDWLVGTPEPGKQLPGEPKPEFGYQEPPQRRQPDNDAQMSLW